MGYFLICFPEEMYEEFFEEESAVEAMNELIFESEGKLDPDDFLLVCGGEVYIE